MSNKNTNLNQAKQNKNDKFYTQLHDIENELKHYKDHFKNKTIFCNCDDPEYSNFYFYFREQFNWFKLKKLITTHFEYDTNKPSYKLELINNNQKEPKLIKTPLQDNGDFRSNECIELLKESDIVITNPPFSLFKDYIQQLIHYNKKFLIIGPISAITRKEVFNEIKNNKIWLGYGFKGTTSFIDCNIQNLTLSQIKQMIETKQNLKSFGNIHWYTNLEHSKRNETLILWNTYSPEKFPKYYNYDAININKYYEIPKDYHQPMGVPITFLNQFNPDQFQILGISIPSSINFSIHKLEIIKDNKPTGKFIKTNGTLYIPYNHKKKSPLYKDANGNLYQTTFKRLIIQAK